MVRVLSPRVRAQACGCGKGLKTTVTSKCNTDMMCILKNGAKLLGIHLSRLQVVHNLLASGVSPRSASATELRQQLHWLPVHQRITYKLVVITCTKHSAGTGLPASPHLQLSTTCTLRSSNRLLLSVPRIVQQCRKMSNIFYCH